MNGIENIELEDINMANKLNFRIKLLGITEIINNKLFERVHPSLIKKDAYIANINGVMNAVILNGMPVGQSVLQGEGAGPGPTSSALMSDLLSVLRGNIKYPFGIPSEKRKKISFYDKNKYINSLYMRFEVKDKPGVAASIFKPLSNNLINVDMVVQNISQNGKETDLTFTIKREDLKKSEKLIKQNKNISYKKIFFDKDVSKVSIIGVGMITTPGITYRMFQALASKKINILVISTSEIKISVLIYSKHVKKAVSVLHKEFKLD